MKKLSDAQVHALGVLNDAVLDDFGAATLIGKNRAQTLAVLEEAGFVRYYPYGGGGKGTWRLTEHGRTKVRGLLGEGRLVMESDDMQTIALDK